NERLHYHLVTVRPERFDELVCYGFVFQFGHHHNISATELGQHFIECCCWYCATLRVVDSHFRPLRPGEVRQLPCCGGSSVDCCVMVDDESSVFHPANIKLDRLPRMVVPNLFERR